MAPPTAVAPALAPTTATRLALVGAVADTYWNFQTTPTLMAQVADACQRHFEGERS